MSLIRKWGALALALLLVLGSMGVTAAEANTQAKISATHGDFAAQGSDRYYLIFPETSGSTLYSMPAAGGSLTRIDSAVQLQDAIVVNDVVYYLRYVNSTFQVMRYDAVNAHRVLATFASGSIAFDLSWYEDNLYVLVDNLMTRINPTTGEQATVSTRRMSEYTISDGYFYYASMDNTVTYTDKSLLGGGDINQLGGQLYAMSLDGGNDVLMFDQGVTSLRAYGDYVYFHNLNDHKTMAEGTEEWLEGLLYRLNVETNQLMPISGNYDWKYEPTAQGVVIYKEQNISLAGLDGSNLATLYAPEVYTDLAVVGDSIITYEYTLKKLTRIPLDNSGAVLLYQGDFTVSSDVSGTANGAVVTPTSAPVVAATAAPAVVPTTAPVTASGSSSLRYGDAGDAVTAVQKRLVELGYLTSSDGKFGSQTLAAVIAFQSKAGLTADGVVGPGTLTRLNASDAPKATTASTSPTAAPATAASGLRYGSTGDAVKTMQKRLVELGYLTSADGYFGTKTLTAVKAFQTKAGLTADGIVGSVTLKRLNASDAPKAGTTTTPVDTSTTLRYGSTGDAVKAMQKRLVELGYLKSADGQFGSATLAAVKAFQTNAKLTADGIAGPTTLKRLNASDAPKATSKPSTGTDGTYIFANSSKQKLTREEVLAIDKALWPYARNEIYARNGYAFDTKKFADYFATKSWYKKGGFDTKNLSDIEWYNMDLIKAMEEEFADDAADEYLFAESSIRKLTVAEIKTIDKALWPYARNEIYARHGYEFKTKEFADYFAAKSWYVKGGFDTKNLSEIEWYNMDLIKQVEEGKK